MKQNKKQTTVNQLDLLLKKIVWKPPNLCFI